MNVENGQSHKAECFPHKTNWLERIQFCWTENTHCFSRTIGSMNEENILTGFT